MADQEPEPPDDPWLTLAEIAEELRMSPATVRSWVSKGTLRAMRAGQRKWLVRRSELDRMLNFEDFADAVPSPPDPLWKGRYPKINRAPEDIAPPGSLDWDVAEGEPMSRGDWFTLAEVRWESELLHSEMAPPDAAFPDRIRRIAEAAARRAGALAAYADDPEFSWKPIPGSQGMTLSYELRPEGNRPGPKDAWDQFDHAVGRLGVATEGDSIEAVQNALEDLSLLMHELAETIEDYAGPYPWYSKQRDRSGDQGDESDPDGVE